MEEFPKVLSGWSWEENKLFELALAVVDEKSPNRWENVAAMVGGKSAEEVEKHYLILLEDLQTIESGEVPLPDYILPAAVDHIFGELQLHLPVDCGRLACWTDEEQNSRFARVPESSCQIPTSINAPEF